jgi:hypothetical protein
MKLRYYQKKYEQKVKQGQRKAWHIPSPKNLTLTFDLENQ